MPPRPWPHSRSAQPGVEVDVFRSGTTEVMGKLAAEFSAGAPRADVLLLADAATMEALKKDGRLLPYREAKVDGLDPGTFDADRTYFGSKLITTGIAVNTAAKTRPTSWADLAKPEYKGRSPCRARSTPAPRRSCSGTMTSRPDLGWSYFEKLKAADAVAVRGNGAVVTAVANGEKSYGVLGRLHGVQRQGEGLAHRLHLSGRRPAGGDRAGRDPEDDAERGGRARVRRFHPLRRGTEARGRDGLHPGQSPVSECRRGIRRASRST